MESEYHIIEVNLKPKISDNKNCSACRISQNEYHRPNSEDFEKYLSFFLQDNPDAACGKGGHAAYSSSVKYEMDFRTKLSKISDSSFMTYHTILKTSSDYFKAIMEARVIATNITNMLNSNLKKLNYSTKVEVFPYSVFYVFYEQYLTMWPDTVYSTGISIFAICLATFLFMGIDIFSSIVVIFTITMILVNLGGLMYWWHITLNAVSLVNLVMVRTPTH